MGKRSRAATKGLKPKKMITGAQRKARKINIEVARRAKKKGGATKKLDMGKSLHRSVATFLLKRG